MTPAQIADYETIPWQLPMHEWTPEQRDAARAHLHDGRRHDQQIEQRLTRRIRNRYERVEGRERRAELQTIAHIRRPQLTAVRPTMRPIAASRSRRSTRRRAARASRGDPDGLAEPDPAGLPWPKLALRIRRAIRETDPPVSARLDVLELLVRAVAAQEGEAA